MGWTNNQYVLKTSRDDDFTGADSYPTLEAALAEAEKIAQAASVDKIDIAQATQIPVNELIPIDLSIDVVDSISAHVEDTFGIGDYPAQHRDDLDDDEQTNANIDRHTADLHTALNEVARTWLLSTQRTLWDFKHIETVTVELAAPEEKAEEETRPAHDHHTTEPA